ncbi:winged helix-turn-helix transcriptional regulator [Streptomyces sp. NPDC004065]
MAGAVSYRLTESGAALGPALEALGAWAEVHLPEGGGCPGGKTCD